MLWVVYAVFYLHVDQIIFWVFATDLVIGPWTQDEYQTLFDLVNMDLRMKAFEEKKTKHGMVRELFCYPFKIKTWSQANYFTAGGL